MTYTTSGIKDFLTITPPFDLLPAATIEQLAALLQPLRYRMGQAIVVRETMPAEVAILHSGQARLLGYPHGATAPPLWHYCDRGLS